MPRSKPKSPKRKRAPLSEPAESRLTKIRDTAFDMEEPLLDIANFVQALQFIGHGIAAGPGEPIMTIASAMGERLDELKESWRKILRSK